MEKHFSRCSERICFGTIIAHNIYDLRDGLTSLCKIFSEDTSLFSKAINKKKSETEKEKD